MEQPSLVGEQPAPPWGLKEILQAIGLLMASIIFAVGIVGLVAAATDASLSSTQELGVVIIGTLILDIVLFGLAAAFTVWKFRLRWRALGFSLLRPDRVWVPAATVVAIFAVLAVYGIIVQLIGSDKLLPESTLEEDIFNHRALVVLAGMLAVIAAPIAEETFFRGFLFVGLTKRFGFIWAALISGFLFSLAHAQPTTLIPFTLVGMILAWAYIATGSLWGAIAAHLIFNFISFLVALAGLAE
jgi:membrane protease YdiL (CAAX protease family)